MYRFNLSAPGTVYLVGEHVMGYNKTCVAASLNKRTKVMFISIPLELQSPKIIEIEFSSIGLCVTIPLDKFRSFFEMDNSACTFTDNEFHKKIETFINIIQKTNLSTLEPRNKVHQASLQAFLYLLVDISRKEQIDVTPFAIKVVTEMMMGHGLGSSASFVVCLATCFSHWSQLQKGFSFQDKLDKEKIAEYASKCDSVIFNSQNTIESNVSVYGSVTIFDGILQNQAFTYPPIRILLVFSKVSKKFT
ncbi:mevalonate kinase-like [Pogonomyrmex barbatus]|uniref:Mevalonate kinase-like n=1 Tax=Pogonomyrmex barbatus TaxID=144034 RepID=A0A6I9WIU5_9HYME|nr:mevalonate kinase-like [Pogonomyrmex barbatus]